MTNTAGKPFFWTEYAPFLLSILRIVSGLLFMQHGAQKLFGLLEHAQVPLFSLMGFAGVLEFFGGLLIVLGLFTRPTAFILSGQMAFAYFMVHNAANGWPVLNGGGMAVMFCFVFLYLSAAGAGPWSVDRLIRRK